MKDMMLDKYPDSFHAVISLGFFLSCFFFFLNTGFETWDVTFYELMLVVVGAMRGTDTT